ncbi:DNA-3-methyladenine glycosylase I [Pseudidiomarina terrestris]|uniref:DNA-3-methyladenine glycosylase I n=1 Tax=Pseudidiomarina terrestris TaxID=2820060 RepID=UPI00265302F7|nr:MULTISPECIES: DNA-3-methyladenine glycosylase I [unclassified Pseudidiomarina]MDN7127997.1 DNA-3-methyladenine glycosylase I [Pseudidiomarina sp. 1APR75-33.1]MDN7135656.1 DNA-3-methyladenine glycosylase I [Pseudidiomarina sp. 1ASP75-5]MDN7137306.1 DNA-3-methyladenine glycosylase I [Pseudidiomarina sp. 1ASP75-14]MEA3588599.1 DNA-3-methyladenine glycosylase I [Pseudidiomarina sp. 1APP75-27a]
MQTSVQRCSWCGTAPDYVRYHDEVWGRPVADSQELFAKLCLDGQQAGLSWLTILRKQANYEAAFCDFNPDAILQLPESYKAELMENAGIVRNRLKIESIFKNARAYVDLREQGQPFAEFLWQFSDGTPRIFARQGDDIPTSDEVSDTMAKALKKAGFSFVGTTICYAFMQAVGMVNDHVVDCHCYDEVCREMRNFSLTSREHHG